MKLFDEYYKYAYKTENDKYLQGYCAGLKWIIDEYFGEDYREYQLLNYDEMLTDAYSDEYNNENFGNIYILPNLFFDFRSGTFFLNKEDNTTTTINRKEALSFVLHHWLPTNNWVKWEDWLRAKMRELYDAEDIVIDRVINELKG